MSQAPQQTCATEVMALLQKVPRSGMTPGFLSYPFT
jgi:hypothetical protein